eukprot:9595635-Lingulodinium_polyedra.AAC.1
MTQTNCALPHKLATGMIGREIRGVVIYTGAHDDCLTDNVEVLSGDTIDLNVVSGARPALCVTTLIA